MEHRLRSRELEPPSGQAAPLSSERPASSGAEREDELHWRRQQRDIQRYEEEREPQPPSANRLAQSERGYERGRDGHEHNYHRHVSRSYSEPDHDEYDRPPRGRAFYDGGPYDRGYYDRGYDRGYNRGPDHRYEDRGFDRGYDRVSSRSHGYGHYAGGAQRHGHRRSNGDSGGSSDEQSPSPGRQAQLEALRDELRAARRQMETAARREASLKHALREVSSALTLERGGASPCTLLMRLCVPCRGLAFT